MKLPGLPEGKNYRCVPVFLRTIAQLACALNYSVDACLPGLGVQISPKLLMPSNSRGPLNLNGTNFEHAIRTREKHVSLIVYLHFTFLRSGVNLADGKREREKGAEEGEKVVIQSYTQRGSCKKYRTHLCKFLRACDSGWEELWQTFLLFGNLLRR